MGPECLWISPPQSCRRLYVPDVRFLKGYPSPVFAARPTRAIPSTTLGSQPTRLSAILLSPLLEHLKGHPNRLSICEARTAWYGPASAPHYFVASFAKP